MSVPEIYVTSWKIPISVIRQWPIGQSSSQERQYTFIPLGVVLLIISTAFVAARVYVRVSGRAGRFGPDDVLILVAWAFGLLTVGGSMWMNLHAGLGGHIWDSILVGPKGGLAGWLLEFAFYIESNATKISVLLFYRRLFFTMEPRKRLVFIDMPIVALSIFAFAAILMLIFDCRPTAAYWRSMDANYAVPYTCIDRHVPDVLKGAINVLSDIYALLLPQFLIWQLNLKVLCRFRLAFIFGCGWLATGAGIARTVWLSRMFTDRLRDLTWVGYQVVVWGNLETQLGIVCASVPVAVVVANHSHRNDQPSHVESGTFVSDASETLKSGSISELKTETQPATPPATQRGKWVAIVKSMLVSITTPC